MKILLETLLDRVESEECLRRDSMGVVVSPLSKYHKEKLVNTLEKVRLGLKEELKYWKEVEANGKTKKK